ncbi:ribonuclease domain-containing protein [Agrilutibacter solisilvae]|uniref:Ribonuclease n=1 Tax=Agrilutibacter solisilvae TaxID=2763317 RepID=A0A974Y0F0_9GAMM|nr:ribonuclease domain-containing protein [Lysobacter solisilvae]QSX79122.1 ribonuclease [Lysobacter solisilvae]
MRRHLWVIAGFVLLGLWLWSGSSPRLPAPGAPAATQSQAGGPAVADARAEAALPSRARYPAFLPPQAHRVLDQIAQGGPFEYRQDGGVFQNRERQLPQQPRGYYREYTVAAPGSDDRGARRIVTGGQPPMEYWYTDDHYRSFRRFEVSP